MTPTLEFAIQKGRTLDFAAREGWPLGLPADLAEQAALVLGVIDAKVAAAPEAERASLAAAIKLRLDGKSFRATVQPKQRANVMRREAAERASDGVERER